LGSPEVLRTLYIEVFYIGIEYPFKEIGFEKGDGRINVRNIKTRGYKANLFSIAYRSIRY